MKKTWKTILVSMLLVTLSMLSACSSVNFSEAYLVGYSEKPFEQALEDYVKIEAEEGDVQHYSIEWTDGWQSDNAPQDYVLVADQEKVTCTLTISLTGETNEIGMYFVHNTDNDTLFVKGAFMIEDGSQYSCSESEAEEFVEYIYSGHHG